MTEAGYMRNARCNRHFKQYMDKRARECEYINSKAPTIIHKATDKENEYYQSILNNRFKRNFNPLG